MKIIKLTIILLTLCISNTVLPQNKMDNISRVVKVLTFNIFHGATLKGDFNLDLIASIIKEANPDFVALQEVDFKTDRAKKYDLVTELGWRTKMLPLFGKAMDFDNGAYGEGILSKYTFSKVRNVVLPYTQGNEPRLALEIVTNITPKDTIAFVATHLDHLKNEKDRIAQAKKINEVFSLNIYPTILAGDLNAEPTSKPIYILEKIWKAAYDRHNIKYTYPSDKPTKKIDYVMFYPQNRWKVLETKVIQNTIASDHLAYLVTLQLLDK